MSHTEDLGKTHKYGDWSDHFDNDKEASGSEDKPDIVPVTADALKDAGIEDTRKKPLKKKDGEYEGGAQYVHHEGVWKRVNDVKDDKRPISEGGGNFYHIEGVKDPVHQDDRGKLATGNLLNAGHGPKILAGGLKKNELVDVLFEAGYRESALLLNNWGEMDTIAISLSKSYLDDAAPAHAARKMKTHAVEKEDLDFDKDGKLNEHEKHHKKLEDKHK